MELKTSGNNKIKAIIFDLGNVLIRVKFEKMLINQVKEQMGSTAQDMMESAYDDGLFQKFCTGKITKEAFHETMNKRFNLELTYSQFVTKWCNIFEPIEGMPDLLSNLGTLYTIGLLSDTDSIHWQYIVTEYPFLKTIKNPTLSFKTGYMKPNPEIYRIAAENVGYHPNKCLFIDDRQINVEGAQAAGMKAIQFTDLDALNNVLNDSGLL